MPNLNVGQHFYKEMRFSIKWEKSEKKAQIKEENQLHCFSYIWFENSLFFYLNSEKNVKVP